MTQDVFKVWGTRKGKLKIVYVHSERLAKDICDHWRKVPYITGIGWTRETLN